MKPTHRVLLCCALAITTIALWRWPQADAARHREKRAPDSDPAETSTSTADKTLLNEAMSPEALILAAFSALRKGTLPAGSLDTLRKALLDAPQRDALAAILAFLATGQDAMTGEPFAVGKGGVLGGAPTFRTLLLDILGRIDRSVGTGQALTMAHSILEKKNSAEEWALALRNVAWTAPAERSYLAAKTREMLTHAPWRQQPSAGFREAFDVIVYLRDPAFIPDLATMLQTEDRSLQRSAGMALDRLAELAPLEVMHFLNANPEELAAKPLLRADYYSKADLSQPAQRAAVEAYLNRPDVTDREKGKLLAVFASPGSFAADTLLSEPPPEELSPQRTAGLQHAVGEWIRSGRFPNLAEPLAQLQSRLND